jgi:AcrR family transcriptional regulator
MAAVAEHAGVATGTAYVHYASKDELVLAAYNEVKAELGAAIVHIDVTLEPSLRFQAMWRAVYEHLAADAVRARFLLQVDASPYAGAAHGEAMADPEDQLARAASTPDMQEQLTDLPLDVLYDLGLGPAVRLAARGEQLSPDQLDRLAAACWRAISRP